MLLVLPAQSRLPCLRAACCLGRQPGLVLKFQPSLKKTARRDCRSRSYAVKPMAMVNVDFASPSLILGAVLIGCGVLLLQVRRAAGFREGA